MLEAIQSYTAVIEAADERASGKVLAEALRRLGVIRRKRHEREEAIDLCQKSYDVASALGDHVLAAEALNALASVDLQHGHWDDARAQLRRALTLGAESEELRGNIEQNFGIMANIEGDFQAALGHYQRSLDAFRAASSDRGCAVAYHNLGMLSADRQSWDDADDYFRATLQFAESTGDLELRGHVLLNRTEVYIARGQYEDARRSAEEALRIFDQLGSRNHKSNAYTLLGIIYRETGYAILAEARLETAVELATDSGVDLAQAEACRELAVLYQGLGRNQDALKLLNKAHRLFGRLNARRDLVETASKLQRLQSVYLEIVRAWGRSIESTDSYTYGHSGRVAEYSATLAGAMKLDDAELTTLRIGAYLHDLGKIRVPHEILSKPGRLTPDEYELMKLHPVYGLELLASVEFPWDIKPIVRSHHERQDGNGYPDRLRGDEVLLHAQVICLVDVFDALTSTRSYRGAMPHAQAIAEINACRHWWRRDVFEAFMDSALAEPGILLR